MPYKKPNDAEQQKTMLDSSGFKLLNWNIYKGKKDGWQKDLKQFVSESDILTLQESYLAKDLRKLLESNQFYWVGAAAYEYKDINAGVLTASLIEPSFSCSLRKPEPLIRVPKTAMITLYPLSKNQEDLLVANIHMVNFSLGVGAFSSQLEALEEVLVQHKGPIIIAGDFNTWSDKRCALVDAFFKKHFANLMYNAGTVQRGGDEFIGDGRLNFSMGRGFCFMHVDIKPCFLPEAAQLADESLDIIGFARGKDDHAEFVAQHAASRTFDIDTASSEKFRDFLNQPRSVLTHGREDDV